MWMGEAVINERRSPRPAPAGLLPCRFGPGLSTEGQTTRRKDLRHVTG